MLGLNIMGGAVRRVLARSGLAVTPEFMADLAKEAEAISPARWSTRMEAAKRAYQANLTGFSIPRMGIRELAWEELPAETQEHWGKVAEACWRGDDWSIDMAAAPTDGTRVDLRQNHPSGGWWVAKACYWGLYDAELNAWGGWVMMPAAMRPTAWRPHV